MKLTIRCGDGDRTITARRASEHFAVHHATFGGGFLESVYVVTHIGTGCSAGGWLRSQATAIRMARELETCGVNWAITHAPRSRDAAVRKFARAKLVAEKYAAVEATQ